MHVQVRRGTGFVDQVEAPVEALARPDVGAAGALVRRHAVGCRTSTENRFRWNALRCIFLSAFLEVRPVMTEPTPLKDVCWPQRRDYIIEHCIDTMQANFTGFSRAREPTAFRPRERLRDQAYLLQFAAAARMPFEMIGRLWLYDLRNFTSACIQWLQGDQPQWQKRPPFLPPVSWFRAKLFGEPRLVPDKDRTEARLLIDALRQVVSEQRWEDSQRRQHGTKPEGSAIMGV